MVRETLRVEVEVFRSVYGLVDLEKDRSSGTVVEDTELLVHGSSQCKYATGGRR